MKLATAITFCSLYSFAFCRRDYEGPFNEELDVKRYKEELAAADATEFLGNQHHHEPKLYQNLNRRFIPVYPYKDPDHSQESLVKQKADPEEILQYILPPQKVKKDQVKEIIPIKAPREVVIAVMRNATQFATPPQPSDPTIRQYMLRSGDYWDSVWTEEGNPDILRTNILDKEDSDEEEVTFKSAVPISAKLLPGSKLFNLISEIVKETPRLVYIINDE